MVSNIGKITDLAATPSKGLVDGTDKLHSGIIKVLESFAQGDMCISHAGFTITDGGTYTQYNLAQPIKFYKRGEFVNHTVTLTEAYTSTVQHGTHSRYDWVLINPATPELVIVQGTAATTPLVSDITAGYIPIALVHISAGSDDDKFDYSFQTFTMNMVKNSLSIGYDDSGYTESMSVIATADRTTFKNKVANADIRFILADNTADEKFEILSDDDSDGDEGDTEIFSVDGTGVTRVKSLSLGTAGELTITESSDDVTIKNTVSDKDIIFNVNDGGSDSESMRIDGDINQVKIKSLGIGTAAEFTITETSDDITLKNTVADKDVIFNINDGGSDIEVMRIQGSTQRLAIGNTSPDEKLHVTGNVKITNDLTLGGGDISIGNGQDATIKVDATTSTTAGRDLTIEAGSTSTGSNDIDGGDLHLKSGGGDGTGTSVMTFSTKASGVDAVAERMRIHTTGNVGIGTGTPNQKLTVSGSMGAAGFVGAVVEVTGTPGSPVLNLSPESHRTIIADTQTFNPSGPSGGPLALTLPAASGTHQGWEMRIIAKNSAAAADALVLNVAGGSDVIIDATGATIGNASAGVTLVTGKIYTVIHISSTQYMAIVLN